MKVINSYSEKFDLLKYHLQPVYVNFRQKKFHKSSAFLLKENAA